MCYILTDLGILMKLVKFIQMCLDFKLHLPRKMEPIEGSETSAFKPQMPGKYPKENILHSNVFQWHLVKSR